MTYRDTDSPLQTENARLRAEVDRLTKWPRVHRFARSPVRDKIAWVMILGGWPLGLATGASLRALPLLAICAGGVGSMLWFWSLKHASDSGSRDE